MQNREIDSGYIKSVKWGGYSIGISFLRQFLLVPAFMLTIGSEGYAFWIAISAIVAMICALNIGHLHYSSNVLNIAYHKKKDIRNEIEEVQGANYFYLALQFILGIVVSYPLLLSLLTNFPTPYIKANNFTIGFLFLLSGKIIYQYCNALFLRLFEPIGKIRITLKYRTLNEAADFLATAVTIYVTKSIFYTCIVVFTVNILCSILNLVVVHRQVPFKIVLLRNVNLKRSVKFIGQSFMLNLSFLVEKIHEVGLNIIVVNFFRPEVLPLFSTSRTITNIFYRFGSTAVIPLFPAIQKQFAMNNLSHIYNKMRQYWQLSTFIIIVCVTLGLPFLPYLYKYWTKGELVFNVEIVGFLFMAILFQNFGMIINEYFKKTNYSVQILRYNIIKSGITVLAIVVCGSLNFKDGLGLALLVGETIGTFYLVNLFNGIFQNTADINKITAYLFIIVLFCVSLTVYLFLDNYLVLFISNACIVIYLAAKNKILKLR